MPTPVTGVVSRSTAESTRERSKRDAEQLLELGTKTALLRPSAECLRTDESELLGHQRRRRRGRRLRRLTCRSLHVCRCSAPRQRSAPQHQGILRRLPESRSTPTGARRILLRALRLLRFDGRLQGTRSVPLLDRPKVTLLLDCAYHLFHPRLNSPFILPRGSSGDAARRPSDVSDPMEQGAPERS